MHTNSLHVEESLATWGKRMGFVSLVSRLSLLRKLVSKVISRAFAEKKEPGNEARNFVFWCLSEPSV